MLKLIVEPVLQRLYSACIMLVAALFLSLNDIGNYSTLILFLSLTQLLFDSDVRNIFLTEKWADIDTGEAKKIACKYLWIPTGILLLGSLFLIFGKGAPGSFLLICLAPWSWLSTLELHILSFRNLETNCYFRNRITSGSILNICFIGLLFVFRDIAILILLQILIEPTVKFVNNFSENKKFSNKDYKSKTPVIRSLMYFHFVNLANWLIALLDRFLLSIILPPGNFGIWTLLNLVFRSLNEAIGVGLTSVLKRDFLSSPSMIRKRIRKLLFVNFTVSIIILICTNFFYSNLTKIFLPFLRDYEIIGQVLTISASVSVSFWIINAFDMHKSYYSYNFSWLIFVLILSPLVLITTAKYFLWGALLILLRDSTFIIFRLYLRKEFVELSIIGTFVLLQLLWVFL